MPHALRTILAVLLAGAGAGILLGWFIYDAHFLMVLVGAALLGAGGFFLSRKSPSDEKW